jgi:hypothetical protein
MNKPTRPKSTPPDIPSKIADRLRYVELTPDEERDFLQKLAEYKAAYHQTGDPAPLWEALCHVEQSGQTVPRWLVTAFLPVTMRAMTKNELKRVRTRWWTVRRYECVRDLRETVNEQTGKKYTKAEALDQAVMDLRAEGDKGAKRRRKLDKGVSRDAVEDSYDKVRRDLERRGHESQYYFYVNRKDEGA